MSGSVRGVGKSTVRKRCMASLPLLYGTLRPVLLYGQKCQGAIGFFLVMEWKSVGCLVQIV
jgi:hypothetical protein